MEKNAEQSLKYVHTSLSIIWLENFFGMIATNTLNSIHNAVHQLQIFAELRNPSQVMILKLIFSGYLNHSFHSIMD